MGCMRPAIGSVEFHLADPSSPGFVTVNMGLPTRASHAHDVSSINFPLTVMSIYAPTSLERRERGEELETPRIPPISPRRTPRERGPRSARIWDNEEHVDRSNGGTPELKNSTLFSRYVSTSKPCSWQVC